jgi:gelsolin
MAIRFQSPHQQKVFFLSHAIRDEREGGAAVIVLDEGEGDLAPFWKFFGGPQHIAAEAPPQIVHDDKKVLYRLSDASGTLKFTKVAEGQLKRSSLDSKDVFILDSGFSVFVWVGQKTSPAERKTALQYAVDYLKHHERPTALPISRILDGGENEVFLSQFS